MWTDRFEKRERFPGGPAAGYEYHLGDRKNGPFVSVDPSATSFDDPDIWDIHLHVSGASTIQAITGLDKALRIAQYLYDELLPEHLAERERSNRRTAEWEAKRRAQAEEERPARVAAARERAKKLEKLPTEHAVKCPECAHVDSHDEFDVPGYECSRCGSTGRGEDGRRCDQCHIFRARASDETCPHCETPVEAEPVKAKNLDGEWVEVAA